MNAVATHCLWQIDYVESTDNDSFKVALANVAKSTRTYRTVRVRIDPAVSDEGMPEAILNAVKAILAGEARAEIAGKKLAGTLFNVQESGAVVVERPQGPRGRGDSGGNGDGPG